MTILGQDRAILWIQPDGPGTSWKPFGVGEKAAGVTGKTVPGAGRTPVYGRTEFGKPVLIKMNAEAPGDLPSATIQLYERGQIDVLLRALQRNCPINIQVRIVKCGVLNNPNIWDVIDHFAGGQVTTYNPGDAPSAEFNGEIIQAEGSVSFTHHIRLVGTSLSRLTTSEAENLLSIAGIPDEDCNACGNGYPGADQIMYIGAESGLAAANVLYTRNGGGTWAATSADPFVTVGEDISFIAVRFINETQIRVIVATNVTAAGAKARIAWADVDLGDEGTTVWTVVSITNTVNGEVVEGMGWLTFDRLYLAAAGDIYVSEDQGESVSGTAIYTGSTVINGFAISADESTVIAFGASNLFLRELGQSDLFETRVGPSGGGTFYSAAIAGDGTVYAGNGTSIYKSTDQGGQAGNWTELKDFGTNKRVVAIQCVGGSRALGGDSEIIRAVVDDTAGANGQVWLSVSGGADWTQITEVTNLGYNGAYFSQISDNLAVIVGDAQGGTGVIHRLAEKVA